MSTIGSEIYLFGRNCWLENSHIFNEDFYLSIYLPLCVQVFSGHRLNIVKYSQSRKGWDHKNSIILGRKVWTNTPFALIKRNGWRKKNSAVNPWKFGRTLKDKKGGMPEPENVGIKWPTSTLFLLTCEPGFPISFSSILSKGALLPFIVVSE